MTSEDGAYTVYLASPLGFTEPGRIYIKDTLRPKFLALGRVEIIDPWDSLLLFDEKMITQFARGLERGQAIQYGMYNFKSIDRADAVVACLDGPDVDSGTAIEIGYAVAMGKLVIGYRTDYRFVGEGRDMRVNLQVEAAIVRSGGKLCESLDEAVDLIRSSSMEKLKSRA